VTSALIVLVACLSLVARPAVAAPGDLDPSFSDDGKVTLGTDQGWLLDEPDFAGVTVQADGGIVAAGDSGLIRFNPDGSRDDSFATAFEPPSLAAVTAQDDGKLLAAGHAGHWFTKDEDFLLARYEPNGEPDDAFDGDGTATTDFAAHEDQAKALAVQPDGKIVVVGYSVGLDSDDVPSKDFALARYEPDGALDSGFSHDGTRTTDLGGDDIAYDVALQPNGKILVAGSSSGNFAVARYLADGRLDHTFSTDGRLTVRFGDREGDGARALVIRRNGQVFVAGGESGRFTLASLDPDGSLSSGFGGDGVVTTPFRGARSANASASDLALEGNRLLAAGSANGEFGLARYHLDGRLDAGFSGDGKLRTEFSPFYREDAATSIALQGDGRVIVAGSSIFGGGHDTEPDGEGAIARYLLSQGAADADADGVEDSADLCPRVFAEAKSDGCPRFERSISLDGKGRTLYGTVDSESTGCADEARVTVYRVRRHRRTVVARPRSHYDDYYGEFDFYVAGHVARGRYYVTLKRQLRPRTGWCGAARSPFITVIGR
jgi:uncharacterized delta-60 repeat protein